MNNDMPSTLSGVRNQIDQLDEKLVKILRERQALVQRAGLLKKDEDAVRAPGRVEEVITRVRTLAEREGASPDIVERVYRSMIDAYTSYELSERRNGSQQND